MRFRLTAAPTAFLVVLLVGCVAGPPRTFDYTRSEKTQLTACVGLTDTARSIAKRKLDREPIEKVKSSYASTPNAALTVPLVDKVYGENMTNLWDYSVSFFRECALNLASIPDSRVRFADYCMQNGMIAATAQEFRASGAPKEQAYAPFARMGETPRNIVDRVYASSRTRGEEQLAQWDSCMAPITGP